MRRFKKSVGILLALSIFCVVFMTAYIRKEYVSESRSSKNKIVLSRARRQNDIFINSYMRSGSSFMGRLLTANKDVFYWYEPLWNLDSGVYYWGQNLICTGKNICGIARNKTRHNIDLVYSTIDNIFACNFTNLEIAVAESITAEHSGRLWTPYKECRQNEESISACLKEMEQVCSKSNHRAVKSVRLTLDHLEHFLDSNPNLKVIHLIRDPRAIVNSRLTTKWFQIQDTTYGSRKTTEKDAEDLCLRILHDLKEGVKLKRKFPERFIFVMFEDLLNDLRRNSEILYSYLGINADNLDAIVSKMATEMNDNEHTVRRQNHNYADWWRYNIKVKSLNIIDKVCVTVIQKLGYKVFNTSDDLVNTTLDTFEFSDELLIKNIFKYFNYDDVFNL